MKTIQYEDCWSALQQSIFALEEAITDFESVKAEDDETPGWVILAQQTIKENQAVLRKWASMELKTLRS